jgi:Ser/Thr protein kinase RdoA (MazF antagonist)
LFDVATVTLRSRRTDPSGALAEATIAGYQSLRRLDATSLPLFEALRACTYVGWNISRMDEDPTRNARFIAAAEQSIARLGH